MKDIKTQVETFISNHKNRLEELKMKGIANFFKTLFMFTKVVTVLAILGITFYSGMYVVSAQKNPNDAAAVMVSSIEKALEDTSNQPIIMIVPESSMWERVKADFGYKAPDREVVTITTTQAQKILGIAPPEDPSMVRTALTFWGEKAGQVGDGIKTGWNWFSDKVTLIK